MKLQTLLGLFLISLGFFYLLGKVSHLNYPYGWFALAVPWLIHFIKGRSYTALLVGMGALSGGIYLWIGYPYWVFGLACIGVYFFDALWSPLPPRWLPLIPGGILLGMGCYSLLSLKLVRILYLALPIGLIVLGLYLLFKR